MRPITIWEKFNPKTKKYEHNHIQDGCVDNNIPRGTKEQNIVWGKAKWRKTFGYLDINNVVKVFNR